MTIFNFLSLIGGLALFLFGMNVMGSGLEKMGGGKFESVLEKMTNNRIKGVLLGAGRYRRDPVLQRRNRNGRGLCKFRHYGTEPSGGHYYGRQYRHLYHLLAAVAHRH